MAEMVLAMTIFGQYDGCFAMAIDDKNCSCNGCQNGGNGGCFVMAVQTVEVVLAMAVETVKAVAAS